MCRNSSAQLDRTGPPGQGYRNRVESVALSTTTTTITFLVAPNRPGHIWLCEFVIAIIVDCMYAQGCCDRCGGRFGALFVVRSAFGRRMCGKIPPPIRANMPALVRLMCGVRSSTFLHARRLPGHGCTIIIISTTTTTTTGYVMVSIAIAELRDCDCRSCSCS